MTIISPFRPYESIAQRRLLPSIKPLNVINKKLSGKQNLFKEQTNIITDEAKINPIRDQKMDTTDSS
ncbi:MAG: hypothetical protein R3Y32_01515 [Bacillota bacterium]